MQNFTLGKRGIPMLLFALTLLTTSFSSFGQENCPTLNDTSPEDFCYLETIQDLTTATGATVTNGTVAWYRTADSTNPVPNGELLQNGNYFVGNTNGNCTGTSRIEVTVSVINVGAPTPSFGSFFQPCEYGPSDVSTVQDLINMVDPSETTYVIEVFDEEFTGDPLPAGQQLEVGENYFVGQRDPDATPSCPSTRVAIEYSPVLAVAPTGDSEQIFCEGATVADLIAEPTSANTQGYRWYSTLTSNPALDPSTPLVNDETYFASQIVNRTGRNQPPCESTDRFAVLVELDQINAGNDNLNAQICQAELQARLDGGESARDIFLSLLDNGVPTDGTFEPSIDQLAAEYSSNPYQTFETTYSISNTTGCTDSAELALTVLESSYAGEDSELMFCRSEIEELFALYAEDPEAAEEVILNRIGENVDRGGTFSAETLSAIAAAYSAAVNNDAFPFFAETTYTVGEGACQDTAEISLVVNEDPIPADDIAVVLCEDEVNPNATANDVQTYLDNLITLNTELPTDGTFSPTAAEILNQYQNSGGIGTFNTVYTVGTDCGETQVNISIQVIEVRDAEAGTIQDVPVDCDNVEPIVLTSLPKEGGNTGGTFSGEGVTNGTFDPSVGPGTYTITYSVDDTADCVTPGTEDSTTFTITVGENSTQVDDIAVVLCEDEVNPNATANDVQTYLYNLITLNTELPTDGTFSPTAAEILNQYQNSGGIGTFNTVYTVGTDCGETQVNISIQVIEVRDAEAGTIQDVPVDCDNVEPIVLTSLPNEGGNTGGTFSGEGVTNGTFDPSVGPGTYTITYSVDDTADCVTPGTEDSTTFTITVGENSTQVDDIAVVLCEDEVNPNATANDVQTYLYNLITLNTELPTDGTFSPTAAEILNQYQNSGGIGTFNTVYTVGTDCGETQVNISIQVIEVRDAEAGTIQDVPVDCDNVEPIVLTSLPNEGGNTGGTFSGEGVTNGTFDPSVGPGTYTITYSVDDTADCVTPGTEDSTTFTITVGENSTQVDDIAVVLCEDEVNPNATANDVQTYLYNLITLNTELPTDGTFSPTAAEILNQYQNSGGTGTFNTVYTVGTDCGETQVNISIQVIEMQDADAGNIEDDIVCSNAGEIDLSDYIPAGATRGGTFTVNGVATETFNPSAGPGEYEVIYFVDDTADCVTPGTTDSEPFTITVTPGDELGNPIEETLCISDVNPNLDASAVEAYFLGLIQDLPQGGTFEPTPAEIFAEFQADPIRTFTTVYSVGNDVCGDSVQISVTVNNVEDADAGTIEDDTVCSTDGLIDLSTYIPAGATTGGTFSGEGVENGMFDPSVGPNGGGYLITYTVDDTADCVTEGTEDSETFTIFVNQGTDLGDDIARTLCISDLDAEMSEDEFETYFLGLVETLPEDGTFEPTLAELYADFQQDQTATFTTVYSVGNDVCGDSVQISVTVNDVEEANAGSDTTLTFCSSEGEVDLTNFLNEDANQLGFFEGLDNNMFNPSEAGVGNYTFTYTVDTSVDCVVGEDSATYTIEVIEGDANAGEDVTANLCSAQVEGFIANPAEAIAFFDTLIADDVDQDGTFDPSLESIAAQWMENPVGTFTTTYTVGEGECRDSAVITFNVTEGDANAGEDGTVTLNEDDEPVNLFNYLGGNPDVGGTWSSGNGTFDPATDTAGVYTYTVGTESCQDSATVTVTVTTETDPTECEDVVSAGGDNSIEVCNSDVRNLSEAGVRDFYLGLLDEGVSTEGTFNPSINEIMDQYNNISNFGDFTTTYTVSEGECQDSAVLTVTVIPANEAGEDRNITLCTTGEAVDLFDYLSPLATLNGTFEGFEDGVFDPADAELGDTIITYEVPEDDSVCSTGNFTATFTITVSESVAANAGDDVTVEYCSELNESIALTSLLSEGAIAGGTFSAPSANGTFNPSVSGEGEYVITYSLDGVACTTGTDSSTITITVVGETEAPVADAEQSFCFVDEPTVGDIVVDGEGVVIYEDAELTEVAEDTDPLVNGASYFASFSSSAACASGVTMITVTIDDSDAPTLVLEGDEFCRQDNPTVQELIDNLNGTGIQIYTAVTGGTALATTTALVDGVTYFASGTDSEGGCESSERLAVQVEVEFCGIPEGFSPNGDGKNDFFVIPDIATDYPNYELEVYNRWGSLVFEGNAGTGDWDGTSNQSATLGDGVLPSGFYFYILNYNDGQTEPVQGKVYLSR